MAITNYNTLVSAVGDWLDRPDLATESRLSTFIQLAEARLNRLLEDPEMEVTSNSTATGAATALPADYGSMVSISTGSGHLTPVGSVEFASFDSISGIPRYYSITDGAIGFGPSNFTTPIRMVYRRRLPALSITNQTNWLMTLAPDVYLYGTLVQAEAFLGEDDRLVGWKAMFDESIDELKQDASRRKWGAGTLTPSLGRS